MINHYHGLYRFALPMKVTTSFLINSGLINRCFHLCDRSCKNWKNRFLFTTRLFWSMLYQILSRLARYSVAWGRYSSCLFQKFFPLLTLNTFPCRLFIQGYKNETIRDACEYTLVLLVFHHTSHGIEIFWHGYSLRAFFVFLFKHWVAFLGVDVQWRDEYFS